MLSEIMRFRKSILITTIRNCLTGVILSSKLLIVQGFIRLVDQLVASFVVHRLA